MNPSGTPALRLTFERSNGRQHLMPSCVSSHVRDIFDCTDHRWTVVRGYMNLHCTVFCTVFENEVCLVLTFLRTIFAFAILLARRV